MPWGLEVFVRTPGGVAGAVPVDGVCEFPTDYVKATPEVLCGVYQPTFLYEILWNLRGRRRRRLADRRFQLGGGRAFAVYVAGYTLGRTWIEMLRIDPANHIFGLRINVFTSVIVFLGAVAFLILRRHHGREDPARGLGPGPTRARARADDYRRGSDEPTSGTRKQPRRNRRTRPSPPSESEPRVTGAVTQPSPLRDPFVVHAKGSVYPEVSGPLSVAHRWYRSTRGMR